MATFTFNVTCASYYSHSLRYTSNDNDCATVCGGGGSLVTVYSTDSPLQLFSYIYGADGYYAPTGSYSDGITCWRNLDQGQNIIRITETSSCATTVYISAAGPGAFDSNGDYNWILFADTTANAYGSSGISVNTTVTGFVTIYADYGDYSTNGSITTGFDCANQTYIEGLYPFQLVSAISVTGVSPSSNGGYNYVTSGGTIGSYSC